jgi:hypothetical protein
MLTADESRPRRFEITIELDSRYSENGEIFVVQLDPFDRVKEIDDGTNGVGRNNYTTLTVAVPSLITADFDHDPTNFTFGQYIKGVALQQSFKIAFSADQQSTLRDVEVKVGGAKVPLAQPSPGRSALITTSGLSKAETVLLTYHVGPQSAPPVTVEYTFDFIEPPDWIKPIESELINTTIAFDRPNKTYVLQRRSIQPHRSHPAYAMGVGAIIEFRYGLIAKSPKPGARAGLILLEGMKSSPISSPFPTGSSRACRRHADAQLLEIHEADETDCGFAAASG